MSEGPRPEGERELRAALAAETARRERAEQLLRLREDKFRRLLESAPFPVTVTATTDGRVLYANRQASDLYEFGSAAAPAGAPGFYADPRDRERLMELLRERGEVDAFEFCSRTASGRERWVSISVRASEFEGHRCLIAAHVDIDARRRAEEHQRFLSQNILDVTWSLDEHLRFTFVSPSVERLTGFTSEELLGQSLFDYLDPAGIDEGALRARLRAATLASPQRRLPHLIERGVLRKDGTLFAGEVAATFFVDARGEVQSAVGVTRDVTARRAAEAALAAEKERLAVTLRSIGDAVVATDTGGRVVVFNRVAEQLTGWTAEEAQGRPVGDVLRLVDAETREPRENPVARALASLRVGPTQERTLLIARDGPGRPVSDSCAPIVDHEGTVSGAVLVFRDATQEAQRQEERLRTRNLESLATLAGGIAHDFNNVLTAVLSNLSLAVEELPAGAPVRETLEEAEAAARRGRGLTLQLLTFSRGGAPVKERTDLGRVVREAVESGLLQGTHCTCALQVADGLWAAEIDEGQIAQVVRNLLLNAVEAMPGGGPVEVRVENLPGPQGASVRLTVRDRGVGIRPEQRQHLFDPYFSTKPQRSGLGLAVCHSIVSKHGGRIHYVSAPGQGTTFSVDLPALPGPARPAAAPPAAAQRRGRVLVVDDEAMLRRSVERILRSGRHDSEAAAGGQEAVELFKAARARGQPFDLVVLDLTMPGGLGGVQTLALLKQLDPQVKAVVSSGYANDPVLAHYADYGFVAVLAKPYEAQDLLATVAQHLG